MARGERAVVDALDRLLNGETFDRAPEDDDLDPGMVATVRHLRTLHDVGPPVGARERVRARIGTGTVSTARDGQTTGGPAPIRSLPSIDRERARKPGSSPRWRAYAELAAVVAILVTLVGGYAVGYRVLPVLTGSRPLITPARPDAGSQESPELRWRFQTGGPIRSEPVVADSVVYVGSEDGSLYAVDVGTGEERWRYLVGTENPAPSVSNGVVYVGGGGMFHAVDAASGTNRWRFQASGVALGRALPAAVDGTIYVTGRRLGVEYPGEGAILAMDAASGTERWRFPTVGAPGASTVDDGVLYVVSYNNVYAVDAATGQERWRMQTGIMLGSLAVVGDTVYVNGLSDGVVIALDAATGQDRWRTGTHDLNAGGLAATKGVVYVTGANMPRENTSPESLTFQNESDVAALDAATGDVLWRTRLGTGDEWSVTEPTVADGRVYVAYRASVIALDAATGGERWRMPLTGGTAASPQPDAEPNDGKPTAMVDQSFVPPVVIDGVVYVAAENGALYAIGESAG